MLEIANDADTICLGSRDEPISNWTEDNNSVFVSIILADVKFRLDIMQKKLFKLDIEGKTI